MTRRYGQPEEIQIAVIARDIEYIKDNVKNINAKLEGDYVTREEFDPIKKIVYGLVGLILVSVVGYILTAVLHK